jgi:hypothetical protein
MIKSEIVFERKERIKTIEFVYGNLKFIINDIPNTIPLFKILNKDVIKEVKGKELNDLGKNLHGRIRLS